MTVARIMSRAQLGLQAPRVDVEVHLGAGLPMLSIVGLPATAVKESKDRVRAALCNAGFEMPAGRITVNLAPADLPKEGGRFDLPIALGILLASGQITLPKRTGPPREIDDRIARCEFFGELALNGELKPVKGLLASAAYAAKDDHEIIVPRANAAEACIAATATVRSAAHLSDVCAHLNGTAPLPPCDAGCAAEARGVHASELDLRDVRGQLQPKRALTIAAAGGHSLLMIGPPGSGKSMLAQRLSGLLPELDEAEALEVATIASVSAVGFDVKRYGRRPFRAPHHTSSAQSLVGGGPRARPGEVSLAHRGVLFLDELPEFDRRVLESLREPLESGVISISRATFQAHYPAAFQLVAAMNPCPCGYSGHPSRKCRCTPPQMERYRSRVSGPLLDRIDLRVEVTPVEQSELASEAPEGLSTATVAARVREAQCRQRARAGKLNAWLTVSELYRFCRTDAAGQRMLCTAMAQLGMSARSYHRTLRVARTIADLEGSEGIHATHIGEALQLKRAIE